MSTSFPFTTDRSQEESTGSTALSLLSSIIDYISSSINASTTSYGLPPSTIYSTASSYHYTTLQSVTSSPPTSIATTTTAATTTAASTTTFFSSSTAAAATTSSTLLQMLVSSTLRNVEVDMSDVLEFADSVVGEALNLTCAEWREEMKWRNLTILDIPDECRGKYTVPVSIILWILFALLTVGTAIGNFMVILAVFLVKKLHTPSNYLIVSLAFSDFFVSLLVMPLAAITNVKGYFPYSKMVCIINLTFDVLLCTSSILNLTFISIDRYLVITRPFQYTVIRTDRLMGIMIAAAWLLSALISIPPVLILEVIYLPGLCTYNNDLFYQIYATCGAFYLPLIIMLVLYGRIFVLARRMSKEDAKNKVLVHTEEEDASENGDIKMQSVKDTAGAERHQLLGGEQANGSTAAEASGRDSLLRKAAASNGRTHARGTLETRKTRAKSNSETKAIKTLGVIMGCFTICWLPFFIMQLMRSILTGMGVEEEVFPDWVFDTFLWLGYVNSFLNPLIYAKFNPEFRKPFREILLFHCLSINTRLRSESCAETYGLPMKRMRRDSTHTRRRSSNAYSTAENTSRARRSRQGVYLLSNGPAGGSLNSAGLPNSNSFNNMV